MIFGPRHAEVVTKRRSPQAEKVSVTFHNVIYRLPYCLARDKCVLSAEWEKLLTQFTVISQEKENYWKRNAVEKTKKGKYFSR